MSGARSRSLSLGGLPSRSSSGIFSSGGYETFKSRGFDLAQAMLTEIEDIIREYDSDLATDSEGSQSASGEGQRDRDNLSNVTRNIYMLLSTELAPKLQTLMKEVAQLRRHNELLEEKMQQQRQRNEKQMEEFEELQCELRAKERQLSEQRRATKTLDLYQGENAMLKMELKTMRVRMEKMAEHSVTHTETHSSQEKAEAELKKASSNESNEWLLKENAELQREVTRWKAESIEKDVVINELKGVIKNITVPDTPRGSVQRRVSTAHYRPDSLATPPQTRQVADLVPLINQVGGSLTLETPRGVFRSIIAENTGQAAGTQTATTTLAEDLGVIPTKSVDSRNGQAISVPSERRHNRRRGPLGRPVAGLLTGRTDISDRGSQLGSLGETVGEANLEKRLMDTIETMENACLDAEDYRASWLRKAGELETTNETLKLSLMQTEERLLAVAAEVEGLRGERLTTILKQREAQKQLQILTDELREKSEQIERLNIEMQKMHRALEAAQTQPSNEEHLHTQAVEFYEGRAPSLEIRGKVTEPVLLSDSGAVEHEEKEVTTLEGRDDSVEEGMTPALLPIETFQILSDDPPSGSAGNYASAAVSPKLYRKATGIREHPQHGGALPRGERIKVVLKNCKPKDCCSPFALFTMWWAAFLFPIRRHAVTNTSEASPNWVEVVAGSS